MQTTATLAAPAAPARAPRPRAAARVVMVLTFVWRVQDLFPPLGKFRPAILSSLLALGFFLLGPVGLAPARLRHPVFRWALAFLAVAVLSVPAGIFPGNSFRFLTDDHLKTVLFAVLLLCAVRSVADVERFVAVHVVGGALYCVMILVRYDVGPDGRLGGLVYYDANDLAMLVVCTFPLLVYLTRPGSRWLLRLVAVAAMGLFVVTIIKTGSRGGFLGLVAVFGTMLVGFRAVPKAQRLGALGAVMLVLAVAGGSGYWKKMETILRPQEDYNWGGNRETGRVEVWKRGMGYMLQRPLLGVGAANFPVAEGRISPLAGRQELGQGLKWSAAHNSFVQVGAELGVPGLLAFLLLLSAAFRATRALGRARAPDGSVPDAAALGQALTATLVGYCVAGFFLSQGYSAYLYTILALVAGLSSVSGAGAAPAAEPRPPSARRPLGRGGLVVGSRAA